MEAGSRRSRLSSASKLVLEAGLIVVSILLAFGIDAWWDSTREAALEEEYLHSLFEELERSEAELDGDLGYRVLSFELTTVILEGGTLAQTALSQDTVLATLGGLRFNRKFTPVRSTLDDLISSGRLNLLQSPELRAALLHYAQLLEKIQIEEDVERQYISTRFSPYLADFIPFRRAHIRGLSGDEGNDVVDSLLAVGRFQNGSSGVVGQQSASSDRNQLNTLLLDEAFENILVERREQIAFIISRYRGIRDVIDSIRVMIPQEVGG